MAGVNKFIETIKKSGQYFGIRQFEISVLGLAIKYMDETYPETYPGFFPEPAKGKIVDNEENIEDHDFL